VAMTAHAMKGDRERCLDSGMDGYVAKPILEKELFAAIAAADGRAQPTREGTAEPNAKKAGDGATDLDPLDDERAFQREIAGMFLEDCPKGLTKIREAVAARDGRQLKLTAHTLKGSAGAFDDQAAVDAAFEMEMIGRDVDWDRAAAASVVLEEEMDRLMASLMELTA
jgi:two-component system sensor histidine kinase/response regulator